jgi:hypothetical protein
MLELLFFYQLARNPLEAIARRWYCRSLFGVGARIAPIPDYDALRREPAESTMAHASPIPKS